MVFMLLHGHKYRTRDGQIVFAMQNEQRWLDGLPFCVHFINQTANEQVPVMAPSYTCDSNGRVYPPSASDLHSEEREYRLDLIEWIKGE